MEKHSAKDPAQPKESPKGESKVDTKKTEPVEKKPMLALPPPKPRTFDFKTDKKSGLEPWSVGQFLVALILVILLGIAVAAAIYYFYNPIIFKQRQLYPQPVTNAPVSLYIDIDNPEDETLTFDSSVIISGKTSPDVIVVISSKDYQTAVSANPFGEFSKVFSLSPGMNLIEVSAFDEQGNSKTALRRIYYSEEKIE